ncbi:MAG: DUF456 domain-containing protein [Xanthomonadales bacterium]|nr:DUF456 domain-containing protein [Xanthomonadales bacterium]
MVESLNLLPTVLWFVVVLLFVLGLAGLVLPALPGSGLLLAAVVLGAWIDGFERVGWLTVTACAVLAVLAVLADYVAGVLGAKRVNAHPYALVGAALGTLVGLFGGIVGLLFMPFVGAGLGEWIGRQDTRKDLGRITQVGLATWLGMLIGTVVKLALGFLMVGLFVLALVV